MQTSRVSHYDEFFGKYWLHDERVRTRGSIYGPNAVMHMMSGKAVSRALRGHFLVESALVNKLMLAITPCQRIESELEERNDLSDDIDACTDSEALCNDMHKHETLPFILEGNETADLDVAMNTVNDHLSITEVEKIHNLFEGLSNKTIPISSVYTSKELMKLENLLNRYKQSLAEKSPTAQLWLQYLECVETLKIFIRAERTGDWKYYFGTAVPFMEEVDMHGLPEKQLHVFSFMCWM